MRNIKIKDTTQQLENIHKRIMSLPTHPTPYYLVDGEIYEHNGSFCDLQNLLKSS